MTTQEKYALLKGVKQILDKVMNDPMTKVEIRSNELYDHVKLSSSLKSMFRNQKVFNQFLREQNDSGLMKQVIPNYSVDTSNPTFYQWRFFREVKSLNSDKKAGAILSNNRYLDWEKKNVASNKERLRSSQELLIYEQLLNEKHLMIFYEYPISKLGETKNADFVIRNELTRKEFVWEHFGMTNNKRYKDEMVEKIAWYKNNGFKTLEEGGNLILTYFTDDKSLLREVSRLLSIIGNNDR
ncbi:MAG: hypothetical protein RIM99_12140 [Cyclobacteriaceae bacterium]